MHPILFKIGPITIYTYGVFVFLGVLVGYLVALKQVKKEAIDPNTFSNIVFWTIVSSFSGAKLLYILLEFKDFLRNPLAMIRSGFVFYGGVIFGISTCCYLTRRYKINFRKFADAVSLGVPLGHALGRLGCFFYGCCYGRPSDNFLGLLFPPDSPAGSLGKKVIPTQLISSFFLVLIFFLLIFLKRKKKFDGQIFMAYLIFYSLFRFIIEFFRADERGQILFLSPSQFIALILLAAGIFGFQRLKRLSCLAKKSEYNKKND